MTIALDTNVLVSGLIAPFGVWSRAICAITPNVAGKAQRSSLRDASLSCTWTPPGRRTRDVA